MTDVDALVAFIRASVAEDRRVAEAASRGPWERYPHQGNGIPSVPWSVALPGDAAGSVAKIATRYREDAEHIARWEPATVLAHCDATDAMCEALLQMLDMEQTIDGEWGGGWFSPTDSEAWEYARKLAQPFAGRDGWRDEWADAGPQARPDQPPPPPPVAGGKRVTFEVRKVSHVVPAAIVGTDEQGRTLVMCPSQCGEEATVMEDGRVVCPLGEAESAFLADAMKRLEGLGE